MSSLLNVFKVAELRKKILFTVFILAIYRLGVHIPTPGISLDQVRRLREAGGSGGIVGFLNLFSGGALTNFSVFSLGIMPYITASIIMQLLTVVIPKLEKWSKEGATGQKKITQWTRYLAIALGVMQAATYSYIFHNGGRGFFGAAGEAIDLFPPGGYNVPRVLLVVLTLTAGVALVMWLGELVTQRGIGNGMSILIFANVVSRLPFELENIRKSQGWTTFIIILLFILAMIVAIVFIDNGQRRIPVEFAKRMVGRRMMGGQSTYIPLKVNQAGVVPLIFASSVLNFPVLLGNVLPAGARQWINDNLVKSDNLWYISFYGLLIVFFAYFYTAISFDPHQQAESLQKQGGYIRPIRPGRDTERYLQRLLNRITLPGALFITVIALVPSFLLYVFNVSNFGFAGTSILIAVGVALETVKQIDSQLMLRNYEGFLEGSATRRRPQSMVR